MADENFGEMHDRIAGMLAVLAKVGEGDYESRLEVDLPETHPVGKLYRGINDMIASLASAQQRSAAYRKELEEKLATIEGVMDSSRSADMMNALLQEVSEKGAEYVIIDVTGIEVMDTRTADQFIR